MLMRAFDASAFGLHGGISIPMEAYAAQANVYHGPASRASIKRPIRIHATYSLVKKRGASMSPSKV